jgi:hypothetical protein
MIPSGGHKNANKDGRSRAAGMKKAAEAAFWIASRGPAYFMP